MMRFTCDRIFNSLVVLCDSKVVCGCADPYGERPLGFLSKEGILDIWNNENVRAIRQGLNKGYASFCLNCGLKKTVSPNEKIIQRPVFLETLPRIFFEPTILCNLSCFHAVCSKESGIIKTRKRAFFPYEEFKKLLEPIGRHLIRIDFFNYGEPFAHPQSVAMIQYLKERFPHIYLYTSTNGLLLNEEKIQDIIQAELDEITFSVDGADQKTYSRYRRGGDFSKVVKIMKTFVKLRNQSGRKIPFINWRYILFRWNDSQAQMERARNIAVQAGVDRLTWEITDHPHDAYSKKYQPGARLWRKVYYEIWDTSNIVTAIPGKKYQAIIKLNPTAIQILSGQPAFIKVEIKNTGGALWLNDPHSDKRIVRLGAQLFNKKRELIDLNYARAFLPRPLGFNKKTKIKIRLPAIEKKGNYWLKFDLALEGIAWFESVNSKVTWRKFKVK